MRLMYRCGALNVTKMSHWIKPSFCDTAKTNSDFAWIVQYSKWVIKNIIKNKSLPLCRALYSCYLILESFSFSPTLSSMAYLAFIISLARIHILWRYAIFGSCFWGVSTMTVIPVRVTRGCIHFLSCPFDITNWKTIFS